MYLHNILKRDLKELISRIYFTQQKDPSSADFVELTRNDRILLNIQYSDADIQHLTKYKFQCIVKKKINDAAFKWLNDKAKDMSKMKILKYNNLKLQNYMENQLFNSKNVSLLLSLRTRTVRGIRNDFKGMFEDTKCPLPGCGESDNLQHILKCKVLLQRLPPTEVTYTDVFRTDNVRLNKAIQAYSQHLKMRDILINETSESATQINIESVPCISLQDSKESFL